MEATGLGSRQVMEMGDRIPLVLNIQTASDNKFLVPLEEVFGSAQPGHSARLFSWKLVNDTKAVYFAILLLAQLKRSLSFLKALPHHPPPFFYSHGNKEIFSCWGIQLAVDWFRQRGHTYIKVFVPLWRKDPPRQDSPIAGRSPSWA